MEQKWTLRLNAGDETRIQADSGKGISLAVCDIKCGGMTGRTVAEAEQMAADIVARYNAMQGIADPAAFVAAFDAMQEALDGLIAPLGPGGYVLPAGAVKTARAQAALTAARIARGGA